MRANKTPQTQPAWVRVWEVRGIYNHATEQFAQNIDGAGSRPDLGSHNASALSKLNYWAVFLKLVLCWLWPNVACVRVYDTSCSFALYK